jgi:hypothetical protein
VDIMSGPSPSAEGATGSTALERARARWRATGDRVWSIAVVDGEEYRRVAGLVGGVLDRVRACTPTVDSLLALDADPTPLLGPDGDRRVLEAALAVRGDELIAARARDRRIAAIAAARAAGETWVVLDETAGSSQRTVEMHLATGLALVATADPYAGDEPYALGEVVLDAATGDPLADEADDERAETVFADAAAWRAERARRRTEIASLDGGDTMLSDKRRP